MSRRQVSNFSRPILHTLNIMAKNQSKKTARPAPKTQPAPKAKLAPKAKPTPTPKAKRAVFSAKGLFGFLNGGAKPAEAARVLFQQKGRMSHFGGPGDTGMKPDEGLALFDASDLSNPAHQSLFLKQQPAGTTGMGRRLDPDAFYIACRWDYATTPKSLLRTVEVSVTNVDTGETRKARPADWGPNEKTGRVADLSPGLEKALGLKTDQICEVKLEVAAAGALEAAPAKSATLKAASGGMAEPRIYSCDEWGAQPAKRSDFARNRALGIVIHHTEGANREASTGDKELKLAFATARQIQQSHFNREPSGWSDTGQHFTVSQGGIIMEGRHGSLAAARQGDVVQGAHAGDTEKNEKWFGIEVCGDNRTEYHVTSEQWAALVDLCTWLCDAHGGDDLEIIGHKTVHETSCPGLLMDHLDDLRAAVAARRHHSSDTTPGNGLGFFKKIGSLFAKEAAPGPKAGAFKIKDVGHNQDDGFGAPRSQFVAAKFVWRFHLEPEDKHNLDPNSSDWLDRMLSVRMKNTLIATRDGTPPDIAAGRRRAIALFLCDICTSADAEGASLKAGVTREQAVSNILAVLAGPNKTVADLGAALDQSFAF